MTTDLLNVGDPPAATPPNPAANGAGGAPSVTPPPAANGTANQNVTFDWGKIKETLPGELRDDPNLGTITNVEGLVKSYIHAQKHIGANKLVIPDKHATPDDWKEVFKKLGNPEKLTDYKMNLGKDVELDEEIVTKLTKVAHEKGILPWQLEEVLKNFVEIGDKMHSDSTDKVMAQKQKEVDALKKEWGQHFDVEVRRANAAFKFLIPDPTERQQIIDLEIGTNPVMLKMLAKVSKLMKEDDFLGQGNAEFSGYTKEAALQRAKDIQGDATHPYRNASHPNHKFAKDEVANLYKIAFPE